MRIPSLLSTFALLTAAASAQGPGVGVIRSGVIGDSPFFTTVTDQTIGGEPRAATQAASDCAVDGFVVNAVTGEPIPRARVTLAGRMSQASVSADSSGRWSFTNIVCGPVQTMVTRPGFLPGNSAMIPGGAMRPVPPPVVSSSSPIHGMKLQLMPQAVVLGKVLDDQGDPVMNTQIALYTSRINMGRRVFQHGGNAIGNDLGEYRLPNLSGGSYIICAHANSQTPFGPSPANSPPDEVMGDSCYPGPLEGGRASAMELLPGSETRVDFTLTKVPAVHVRGTIANLPKNMGVSVALTKRGIEMGVSNHPGMVTREGGFDIRGVTPGSYMLASDYWDGGKRLLARFPIEVGASDVNGVVLQLQPGFTVTGTVRFESKSGTPAPNNQVNVNLRSMDPTVGGGQMQWNKERMGFTIPDLPPGTYRIDAFAPAQFYVKSAMLGGRDLAHEEVPIMQAAGPIEVVFSDDGASLEGSVQDSEGKAVSSWVMLLPDTSGQLGSGQPRNVMTRPDGHFKFGSLPPGNYHVFAWDDLQQVEYADEDWMRRNGGGGVAVSLTAGQSQQAQLTQRPVAAH